MANIVKLKQCKVTTCDMAGDPCYKCESLKVICNTFKKYQAKQFIHIAANQLESDLSMDLLDIYNQI